MKKAICATICSVLCICFAFSAFAQSSETVFESAADVMAYVIVEKDYTTPLRIVPAVLSENGESRDVYLVMMLGMKDIKGQVNSSKGGGTGPYSELVKKVIFENVPEGSALVFAGHSLGGMTAQLLRCDSELCASYEILNVLCGGSPLMETEGEAEGSLNRLTDILDMIPYISSSSFCNFLRQIRTAHRENGGYFFNPDGAHNLSYGRNDIWGKYDVFGEKGGNASLSFNADEILSFGDVSN